MVADKGYHSGAVLQDLQAVDCRCYIPEPDRGRRRWRGKNQAHMYETGGMRRV